ncbi:MAG: Ig-like domain-containing protein, partial [Solirubrobacteraceae bacterium]
SCTSPKSYSGLSVASHTVNVRATDAAGNTDATAAAWTWSVTAPPPPTSGLTLKWISPVAGQTFTNQLTLNAQPGGTKTVKKVSYYVDGIWLTSDTSSPYSYSWSPPSWVGYGTHTMKAVAEATDFTTATVTQQVTRVR